MDKDPVVDELVVASVDPTVDEDPLVVGLADASVDLRVDGDPVVGSTTRKVSVSLAFFR